MSTARILIVEDDRIVARDIEQQLLRLGYAVCGITARGDAALDLAVSSAADLVLMDVMVQGPLDGIDAARQIRDACQIPVVFLTAYADADTVRRASLAEPFGYVLKPFEDSQLHTVIGMALYKHASEQRLRESEQRYAVTLASIGDAVIATDDHLTVTFMNPAAERLTGWRATEAAGQPISVVFCVQDSAGTRPDPAPLAAVLAGGVTVSRTGYAVLRARDGSERVIDDSASPILDARGRASGVALVFRDVTARRQAEEAEALRATQGRIELAVRGSNIGVWELAMPDGHIAHAQISLINVWEQLGYRDGVPATGDALAAALFHPDDLTPLRAAINDYLACRSPRLELEARVRHEDGATRWMLIRGVAERNAALRATKLVGTCVDITDSVRAKLALRDAELRWRTMAEALPHLIWTCTREGVSDYFSPQCYAYLGISEAELVGDGVWIASVHPDDQGRAGAAWAAAMASECRYAIELRLRRYDGSYHWFDCVGVPMRDAGGQILKWFGTSTDISARKEAEAAMMQATAAAEGANRAKNQFLANISHELRTPLNGILGYAQILRRDGALAERQRDGIDVIEQSGEYLLTLINDILDFSRIEARKLALDLAEIWLEKFLQVIVEIMRMRAREKGIELVCDLLPTLPYAICADERRLRQVLLNLLANAVRFTDVGEVRLDVAFRAPDRLRFEISDTGIGIAPEALEAIFQPFEQAGDIPRRTGGAGLGLAISRQLVRLMGSDIHVDSVPGAGSRFWFELTVGVLPERLVAARAAPLIDGYAGTRKRVLVADDVKANRAVVVQMLVALGFETIEVADGEAVLASVDAAPVDLILMDAVMPRLDGVAAIARLKSQPRHAGIPVIAISANVSGKNRDKCLAAGADAFLDKPLNMDALLEQMRRLLALTWTYQVAPPAADAVATAPLVYPPAAEIDILHGLAQQGNMRAIAARAAYLVEVDLRYAPFAEHLQVLAKGFESKAVLRLIDDILRAGQP